MLRKIEGLLSTAETASIRAALAGMQFDAGEVTAGAAVRDLKNNLQVTAQGVRLAADSAVIYNSTSIHRVEPSTVAVASRPSPGRRVSYAKKRAARCSWT